MPSTCFLKLPLDTLTQVLQEEAKVLRNYENTKESAKEIMPYENMPEEISHVVYDDSIPTMYDERAEIELLHEYEEHERTVNNEKLAEQSEKENIWDSEEYIDPKEFRRIELERIRERRKQVENPRTVHRGNSQRRRNRIDPRQFYF